MLDILRAQNYSSIITALLKEPSGAASKGLSTDPQSPHTQTENFPQRSRHIHRHCTNTLTREPRQWSKLHLLCHQVASTTHAFVSTPVRCRPAHSNQQCCNLEHCKRQPRHHCPECRVLAALLMSPFHFHLALVLPAMVLVILASLWFPCIRAYSPPIRVRGGMQWDANNPSKIVGDRIASNIALNSTKRAQLAEQSLTRPICCKEIGQGEMQGVGARRRLAPGNVHQGHSKRTHCL